MNVKKNIKILNHVILPVFLGGMIYIIFRTQTLLMFKWFSFLGLNEIIYFFRSFATMKISDWIKFSLPDALWVYAAMLIMMIIWDFKLNKKSFIWIFIAPAFGIIGELTQLFFLPGTFDPIDLYLCILATLFGLIQIKFIN